MIWQLSVLACLGIFGGVLSGLVGVGGGIIFVPALIYVAGWTIEQAAAASFVVIFFAALSSILRNTSGESPVDWRAAALLSAAIVPSSLIGMTINRVVPGAVVKIIFAMLLLVLAYPIAVRSRSDHASARPKLHPALVLLAGAGIGALSGLAGAGGGVVIIPLLVLGLGLRLKAAVATSLVVVLFTSVAGAVGYVASGFHQFFGLAAADRRGRAGSLVRRTPCATAPRTPHFR